MATYAIGDIQGCYQALRRLLDRCRFDPAQDFLWLVGDLINRGPESVAVLRFVKSLGARAVTVLGNHELHLLVVAAGYARQHRGDTLDSILHAPDSDELLAWVRQRKLFHVEGDHALVHAGLLPQWSVAKADALAREVEGALQGDERDEFLRQMYGDEPDRWSEELQGIERLRVITNVLTRLRICTPDGKMEFRHKDKPVDLPPGYAPWFSIPGRRSRDTTILCGHWASLGLYMESNVISIDTGCVWGRELTAVRLEGRQLFQESCSAPADPAPER